jgi:hypothetical protein
MISDGWNCSGPAPSQRRAPLTSMPTPGIFTATSSAKETASMIGPKRCATSSPRRAMTCMTTRPSAPYMRYFTRYVEPSPDPSSSVRAEEAL